MGGLGFPGREEEFLKAQLVRILCSNFIFPDGILNYNEETQKIDVNEEALKEFYYGKEEALNIEYWVHRYPYIMKSGRLEYFIPKHRNEEE